jgi:hypothetical protein
MVQAVSCHERLAPRYHLTCVMLPTTSFLSTLFKDRHFVDCSTFYCKLGMCPTRNIDVISCNQVYRSKAIIVTYCKCLFVVLVMQHAMRTHLTVFSSVAPLFVPYFSTLSHKQQDFLKWVIQHQMYGLIFSAVCVKISYSKADLPRYYEKFTVAYM